MKPIVEFYNNKVEIYDLTASTIQIDIEGNGQEDFILINAGEEGQVILGDDILKASFTSHTLTLTRTSEAINVVALYAVPIIKGEPIITSPEVEMELIDDSISTFTIGSGSSGVGSGVITASDINDLVDRVNAEADRRNKTGAFPERAVANQAVRGEKILATKSGTETITKSWGSMSTVLASFTDMDADDGTGVVTKTSTLTLNTDSSSLYGTYARFHIGNIYFQVTYTKPSSTDKNFTQSPSASSYAATITLNSSTSYSTGDYIVQNKSFDVTCSWKSWYGASYSCTHTVYYTVQETSSGISVTITCERKSNSGGVFAPIDITCPVILTDTYVQYPQSITNAAPSFANVAIPLQKIKGSSAITIPTANTTKILATGQGSYAYLSQQTAVLSGYAVNSTTTGCASSCTGLCSNGCTGSCGDGCTSCTGCSGCGGACSSSCTGGCSGSCTGDCGYGCEGGCDGACTNTEAEYNSFTPGCTDCC